MQQIPVRILNQDTAGVLARVEKGETVEITSRGRAVARISPVVHGETEDLALEGRLIPAKKRVRFVAPKGEIDHGRSATEALLAMRDEERW
ncbi:type II toxin-antitoxin system Phd/YefM family antitoxin [Actinokineospora sp.]|uniref:type II toxin-antitoxin system Phd/YefM family antitoxin n=1 Tax=Actinokineospora sp. TaxID=1872133 RepID=UPI003D6A9E8F